MPVLERKINFLIPIESALHKKLLFTIFPQGASGGVNAFFNGTKVELWLTLNEGGHDGCYDICNGYLLHALLILFS